MTDVVRLEYSDAKSNKFWQIAVEGSSHTVTYGKIGSAGTSKTAAFPSEAEARKSADKLIASKKKKGYVEVPGESGERSNPKVSAKKSATSDFEEAAFASSFGIVPPARFQKFVATGEAKKQTNKHLTNLPGYTRDAVFEIEFCSPGFELFDENGIDRDDYDQAWMPLASIVEEPQFLAVNLSEEACPVAMWEHEDGKFKEVAPSLDAFLGSLVAKNHKPSIKVLKEALTKAKSFQKTKKYEQAIKVLEGALAGWTPGRQPLDGNQRHLPDAYNLLGICLSHVGRLEDAIVAYQAAVECGTMYAALNILDAYSCELKDPAKVISYSEELKGKFLDDYCWFWVRKYVGEAHIALGASDEAEAAFRAILERYQSKDSAKMEELVEGLQAYLKDGNPNPLIAESMLALIEQGPE